MTERALSASLAILFLATLGMAQASEPLSHYLPPATSYDAAITAPDAYLGHPVDAPLPEHSQVIGYLRLLAEQSDRLSIETIGHSHKRKPIVALAITAPDNQARIDAIRRNNRAVFESEGAREPGDDAPLIAWVGFGVHGNETSVVPSAMLIAYHYAAAEGEAVEELLADTVILLVGTLNPDGYTRAATWHNMNAGVVAVEDPAHREHRDAGLWPGGRSNHYWFDLNRQYVPASQPEAAAALRLKHAWKPHVLLDMHEMTIGNPYYFSPGEPAMNNPMIQPETLALQYTLSDAIQGFLDEDGELYWTDAFFDSFSPAMASTYPMLAGSVSLLLENAGFAGRAIETQNGVQTMAARLRRHTRVVLAFIDGLADQRQAVIDHQAAFYRAALADAGRDDVAAYVFDAGGDQARLARFIELLSIHDIAVYPLTRDVTGDGRAFSAGEAYVVPFEQPNYRLIASLLQPRLDYDSARFYDSSTWTQPLAFGLNHAALDAMPAVAEEAVATLDIAVPPPPRSDYAYAFAWQGYYAPYLANKLTKAGVRLQVLPEPATVLTPDGEAAMPAGSMVVLPPRVQDVEADEIHRILAEHGAARGVTVHAVTSGRTPQGPDFDNILIEPIVQPTVLLPVGGSIRSTDAGELWHLLDHEMQLDVTIRTITALGQTDLSRYTHIVMPDGSYGELDEAVTGALTGWVRGGGTLIAFKRAAVWAVEQGLIEVPVVSDKGNYGFAGPQRLAGAEPEETEFGEDYEAPERQAYADKAEQEARQVIRGAIFAVDLDLSHPIALGYDEALLPTYRETQIVFDRPPNPYSAVAVYTDEPLMSGFVSDENLEMISGSAMLIADRVGRGAAVLSTSNLNFRANWLGSSKLLMNALFFSKVMKAEGRRFSE